VKLVLDPFGERESILYCHPNRSIVIPTEVEESFKTTSPQAIANSMFDVQNQIFNLQSSFLNSSRQTRPTCLTCQTTGLQCVWLKFIMYQAPLISQLTFDN